MIIDHRNLSVLGEGLDELKHSETLETNVLNGQAHVRSSRARSSE
jgi:hypothetical protein